VVELEQFKYVGMDFFILSGHYAAVNGF